MGISEGGTDARSHGFPVDWAAVALEDVTPPNRKNGIVDGPFGSNLKSIHYRKSGVPIITSGFVTEGVFHAEKYDYVDHSKFLEERRSAVSAGDIVMAKIGERCGASAVMPHGHEPGILSGNALKITVDEARYSTTYIWHVLWNSHKTGKLEGLRTVGAQPALSMASLKKFKIPVPPTKAEQQAIATALSDADAYIESLEQLITKKRQIKQGVMQELLTGTRRLPGFEGEWRSCMLGELESSRCIELSRGDVISKQDMQEVPGDFPIYSSSVHNSGLFGTYGCFMFDEEMITWSIDGGGHFFYRPKHRFSVTNVCGTLRVLSSSLNTYFLALQLQVQHRRKHFDYQTKAHPSVIRREFAVGIPSIREQEAIASVVGDMSAEEEALEMKLRKAVHVKQAMMQQLLTGKIRLL